MGEIKKFIAERGFTLMIYGMITLLIGALLYSYIQYSPARFTGMPWMIPLSGALAITGLATYIVGRVSVAVQRGKKGQRVRAGVDTDGLSLDYDKDNE